MGKKFGWGLIFKEFYMSKTYIRNMSIANAVVTILIMLPLASFQYGNLRLLSTEQMESLYNGAVLYGKYLPAYMFTCFCYLNIEASVKEENTKWRRFQLVTPVSGFQYAFHKIAFSFLLTALMVGISMIYFVVFNHLFGEANLLGELGLLLGMHGSIVMLEMIIMIYGTFFDSYDKAGFAAVLTLFTIVGSIGFLFREKLAMLADAVSYGENTSVIANFENLIQPKLAYIILFLFAAYAMFVFTVGLAYKRREK